MNNGWQLTILGNVAVRYRLVRVLVSAQWRRRQLCKRELEILRHLLFCGSFINHT